MSEMLPCELCGKRHSGNPGEINQYYKRFLPKSCPFSDVFYVEHFWTAPRRIACWNKIQTAIKKAKQTAYKEGASDVYDDMANELD